MAVILYQEWYKIIYRKETVLIKVVFFDVKIATFHAMYDLNILLVHKTQPHTVTHRQYLSAGESLEKNILMFFLVLFYEFDPSS